MMKSLIINNDNAGLRVDKILSAPECGFTRSGAVHIITAGKVLINGIVTKKSNIVRENDIVEWEEPPLQELDIISEEIPLDICYEDKDLLVINKPKNMVVHPAAGNYIGTIVNALLAYCKDELSGINGIIRPGIVHRIDKNTSGLLVVAKTDIAHIELAKQIKEHTCRRTYEAVVCGVLKNDTGTINAPIGRSTTNRKKMAVTTVNSKNAITHYRVITRYSGYTHVEFVLETGRTHQIRVHANYIGHPVLGDDVYGGVRKGFDLEGQCLHAKILEFEHPIKKIPIKIETKLPIYFKNILTILS